MRGLVEKILLAKGSSVGNVVTMIKFVLVTFEGPPPLCFLWRILGAIQGWVD